MISVGSFIIGGDKLLDVVGVAKRVISAGVAGREGRFVSILTSRATSEISAPFLCSVKCKIPHL